MRRDTQKQSGSRSKKSAGQFKSAHKTYSLRIMKKFLILAIFLCVCVCFFSCSDKPVLHEHSYSSWQIETPPTCTESGVLMRLCVCGDIQRTEVAALTHAYDNGVTVVEPSCVLEGAIKYTCRLCGESYGKILSTTSHTTNSYYDIYTDEYHAKTCLVCNKETSKNNHVYVDGECVECHRMFTE